MNVHDFLKDLSVEQIKNYCYKSHVPAAIAMFNVDYDFNFASMWRTCNVFGFQEIIHIQKEGRRVDKRATVGAHHYTDIQHFYNGEDFFSYINNKYVPVAVENNLDYLTENALTYVPPLNACFIFGAENKGLDKEILDKCKDIITIPNYGCIRSLNVGCTAAIIMGLYSKIYR